MSDPDAPSPRRSGDRLQALVPLPVQLVIDDVGWRRGADDSPAGGPYRTGVEREHGPEDYAAIVALGRSLGIRPLAALVVCEWDIANRLRRFPTTQWQGADWDNRPLLGPWLERSLRILADGADACEPAVHGVGHEYWLDGRMQRAEWHDAGHRPRPRSEHLAHLEAFQAIWHDHGLGPLPRCFVPCAFLHRFGLGRDGLAGPLADLGIRCISTTWSMAREREPESLHFGVDAGIMTIARGDSGVRWRDWDTLPAAPPAGPVCGIHWPNLLHPDPARNGEVVERWAGWLRRVGDAPGRMLARDSREHATQTAYHAGTRITGGDGAIELDVSAVDAWRVGGLADGFVLDLPMARRPPIAAAGVEITACAALADGLRLGLRRLPHATRLRLVPA